MHALNHANIKCSSVAQVLVINGHDKMCNSMQKLVVIDYTWQMGDSASGQDQPISEGLYLARPDGIDLRWTVVWPLLRAEREQACPDAICCTSKFIMARNQNCPTETSPLLPKDVEASRVDIPDSTASTRVAVAQGTDHAVTEGEDGRDSRLKQYEGMPELRKQMPYLFPALCVGVRSTKRTGTSTTAYITVKVFLAAADQTIIVSSYGRIGSDLHALNKTSWIATA